MSLQSRLADLITAIGADIKALQSRVFLRTTIQHSTASLAVGATEQSTFVVAPSFRAYKVSTNRPARVRVYATAAQRAGDVNRTLGNDPQGDHGLLFELVTSSTGGLSFTLSPAVDFTADGTDSSYFMAVTPLETAGVVTTTFYYVRTE